MTLAAGLLGAPLWLAAVVAGGPRPPTQQISVEVRGPIALVEVKRALEDESGPAHERILDVALPEDAGLVDVSVRDGGSSGWRPLQSTEPHQITFAQDAKGWRPLESANAEKAAVDAYGARLRARALEPARVPFDDATTFRLRVARANEAPRAPIDVRYRFAVFPTLSSGRWRVRFPGSPERLPDPADVRVEARGVADVQIGGEHPRGAVTRVPTRSAWEISWTTPRPPAAAPAPTLSVSIATSAPSKRWPDGGTIAVLEGVAGRRTGPPPNVLFVIDRSRSVGPAGAAAERDLADELLERLPPSTHFDVLFFDRTTSRLFHAPRPATRDAITAIEGELVPDRLRNGTDLGAALREAGALIRREASSFAPRTLVAILTDGALPEEATLADALGETPGVEVRIGAWIIRPVDDDPAPEHAFKVLGTIVSKRGGILHELRANQIGDTVVLDLEKLAVGGDLSDVRLTATGTAGRGGYRVTLVHLSPGQIYADPQVGPGTMGIEARAGGAPVRARVHRVMVDEAWIAPLPLPWIWPRRLVSESLDALLEPFARPAADEPRPPRGTLDREVVRNTLSLAFMPRARACYLSRTAATAAERDLAGRVRLAIDLTRGEVGAVTVQSSTLNHPAIEACLRDGAFALEVPRALRSDAPSTAILNLVFRPRTPERHASADEAALGEQIDLIIEEAHRDEVHRPEAPPTDGPPAPDRSVIPTR